MHAIPPLPTRDLTRLLPGTPDTMGTHREESNGRTDDMIHLARRIFPTQIEELLLATPTL